MGTDQKRTLIFPPPLTPVSRVSVAQSQSVVPPDVDSGWDDGIEELSSGSVIPDDPEFDQDERPSGRKTIPNELALKAPDSSILSASELDDDPSDRAVYSKQVPYGAAVYGVDEGTWGGRGASVKGAAGFGAEPQDEADAVARALATTRPPPPPPEPIHPTLKELALQLEAPPSPLEPLLDESAPTQPRVVELLISDPPESPVLELTPSSIPPISLDVRPPMTSAPAEMARSYPVPSRFPSPRTAALFAASNFAVGAMVLVAMVAMRPEPKPAKRAAHIAIDDRATLSDDIGATSEMIAPLEGCKVQDLARRIATRADLAAGLDASALESGFGVGLAASTTEAIGVRLDADTLRTAETIRLKTPWPFAHVTVDTGDDPDARMDVHVDGIYAKKGGVFGKDGRILWPLPGPVPKGNEPVRAATRADGTSIVAVRRPAHFFVGVEGSGALVPVLRPRKQLGTPSLVATSDGGIMAWAERDTHAFNVYAATIAADGKHTTVGEPMILAEGMSPSLAKLPSGELLLTYSDGGAGAHRVVAQRLGPDLNPRGELLVVSAGVANAGQPAVAVDSEGRAVVAFVAFDHGHAEVHATQLLCR